MSAEQKLSWFAPHANLKFVHVTYTLFLNGLVFEESAAIHSLSGEIVGSEWLS